MAAKTSTGTAVIAAQSSLAASTYASPSSGCQSASQDLTTILGAMWTLRGTNGTAPGVGCSWQIDTSYDGTTWRQFQQGTFGITASTSYDIAIDMPFPTMYTRVTFFGNTTNTVTVSAELQKATGVT